MGNGDGTFRSPVSYSVGVSPNSIVAGSFFNGPRGTGGLCSFAGPYGTCGSGHANLVVADRAGGQLAALWGNGDGTFVGPVYLPLDCGGSCAGSAAPTSLVVGPALGADGPTLLAGDASTPGTTWVFADSTWGSMQNGIVQGAGLHQLWTPETVAPFELALSPHSWVATGNTVDPHVTLFPLGSKIAAASVSVVSASGAGVVDAVMFAPLEGPGADDLVVGVGTTNTLTLFLNSCP